MYSLCGPLLQMESDYKIIEPKLLEVCISKVAKMNGIRDADVIEILDARYQGIARYIKFVGIHTLKIYDPTYLKLEHKPNPNVVFFYYSQSSDSPKPGKGSGESIPHHLEDQFEELESIKGWRKMLSNFWVAEFKLDGLSWASVEHYYQGSKFKKNNPAFYKLFSLNSGSDISKNPLMAKSAGGKSGKIKGKQYRASDVIMDKDFFEGSWCDVNMYRAMYAKFSQNKKCLDVLRYTKDATLTHGTRGVPTQTIHTLMKVREELTI